MHRYLPLVLAGVLAAGCAEQSTAPRSARIAAATGATSSASSVWATQLTGETGPGAQYAIFVPTSWNGDVVYYAHGIVDAALPVALPTGDGFPALRDALGARGYAVAYSSFSENGWAVKDGAASTHALRAIFTRDVAKPNRSYVVGTSLGGLVAANLAEKHGSQYDGTLAMCAPLGGAIEEINYLANVRVLFDFLYPGVVPGDVIHVPSPLDLNTQVLGPAQFAVMSNPTGLGIIARIKQTPLAGTSGPELATSLLYALAYNVRGIDDLLARTHGHSMFDNSATQYEAAFPGLLPAPLLAAINGGVGRFTATPDALNYLEHYYTPDAAVTAPMVTLHTTQDPLVPFFHEAKYAQAVAAAGSSSQVLQRSVSRYGHCAFTTSEMTDAFDALAGWVTTGVKPGA
jgi:pimeloyl-ACP methyl ester carboxylesterase